MCRLSIARVVGAAAQKEEKRTTRARRRVSIGRRDRRVASRLVSRRGLSRSISKAHLSALDRALSGIGAYASIPRLAARALCITGQRRRLTASRRLVNIESPRVGSGRVRIRRRNGGEEREREGCSLRACCAERDKKETREETRARLRDRRRRRRRHNSVHRGASRCAHLADESVLQIAYRSHTCRVFPRVSPAVEDGGGGTFDVRTTTTRTRIFLSLNADVKCETLLMDHRRSDDITIRSRQVQSTVTITAAR